jgi:hypothetical protein
MSDIRDNHVACAMPQPSVGYFYDQDLGSLLRAYFR